MNIAILSYEYPPDTGFGGIGTYSYYHARALVKLGHRVRVIAGSTEDGVHHSEHDGVQVTRIKRAGWASRLLQTARDRRCWWFANRIQGAFGAYEAIRHELKKESYEIIEMPECGADGLLINTLLRIPTVIKFHSPARLIMDMYDTPLMDRELTAFVEQIAINQASAHTSCSRFLADEVREKMAVSGTIQVIPNGIDLELFDRDENIDVHQRFGLPRDAITVFFANRMEERKGIHLVEDMALHLLTSHPDVHFVFAGADLFGRMEQRILPQIRAKKLQRRFHYLGKLDLPEVRAILKTTSIFLLPSLWENCPYSCIEAMSAGRAIVSSDCGGMPELIQDGVNGLLARNDEAASFIEALARMIEDEALRERLGAKARETVEERLMDVTVAGQAARLYESLLSEPTG